MKELGNLKDLLNEVSGIASTTTSAAGSGLFTVGLGHSLLVLGLATIEMASEGTSLILREPNVLSIDHSSPYSLFVR